MDGEDLEGSIGSDIEDLINIECDMDEEDIENIDTSLLLPDVDSDGEEKPAEKTESPAKKVEENLRGEGKGKVDPKTPPAKNPSNVEEKTHGKIEEKTATKTPEKQTAQQTKSEARTPTSKTEPKTDEKVPVTKADLKATSKPGEKVSANKVETTASAKLEQKTSAKKTGAKPAPKTNEKAPTKKVETKSAQKTDEKSLLKKEEAKPTSKSEDKTPAKKLEEKPSASKEESSKKTEGGDKFSDDLVVIDDDDIGSVEGSVDTIEGDVEDFPEEWMVIDEMEVETKSKESSDRHRDDRSRRENESSRYRNRSRRRSRSRSRSRGRSRNDRRSRTGDRDKPRNKTPEKKTPVVNKTEEKSKPVEKKDAKPPEKEPPKKTPVVKQPEPARHVDPFKNMRDTIEKFDKSWRWNLKISPVEISDLKSDIFRDIMALANDSVLVFNMQNDKKRKYGFLDLCLSSAGEIRQAIDKLSQLKLETNFIHVSLSHKLFEKNAGTESALLKLDLREGRHITTNPTKGTEKQRKINISNGPKGMSKIMLDAIFAKIANIVITENEENNTSNATVLCSNPESVGGVLRFYQSVVIGGRRLQIRSEVPPPPPLKEPQQDKKSPTPAKDSKSNNNQKSRQGDNRRRNNRDTMSKNNDGLMGAGPGFEEGLEQRRRAKMEEAERRQESLSRLGIVVGVDDFLERPGLLEAPDIIRKETERLQREFAKNQQLFENNFRQDFRMQEEMRMREIEMRHQAELAEHKRKHDELLELTRRMQQERDQHIQEQKRIEQERMEQDRIERMERERIERERLERDRIQRLERERVERERLERERLEKERKEREDRERKEKLAREQLERERKERERLEEVKRQAEIQQRQEREAKLRQEQLHRDRYLRPELHHGSSGDWQHSLHLQSEQEQFEKEIGLGHERDRKRQSRFERNVGEPTPHTEEKKNLHQKIREQWEKQVAEANRNNQQLSQNNQRDRDSRRNENNGNNQSNWARSDHMAGHTDPYGGNWDVPAKSDNNYGSNWGGSQKGQGLLGPSPNQQNPSPSAYSATVREYGHQTSKRANPWGEETPTYGEKRNRGSEMVDYNYSSRETALMGHRPSDQWSQPLAREPNRSNYEQVGWGSGASDPYRNRAPPQQQQTYNPNW